MDNTKMKNAIIDNSSGPTGLFGMLVAKCNDPDSILSLIPITPSEWLIFFSTGLVICQLTHWIYRFFKWIGVRFSRRSK